MKTKKVLLAIPVFLLWVLYFILTMNKRSDYMAGKSRGMHCTGSDVGLFSATSYFDPIKKPSREYATWREFWSNFGYYKQLTKWKTKN